MQFRYIENSSLDGVSGKMMEQFEIWTLNAIVDVAKEDLRVAAELFGTSVETLLDRLEKHKMLPLADPK